MQYITVSKKSLEVLKMIFLSFLLGRSSQFIVNVIWNCISLKKKKKAIEPASLWKLILNNAVLSQPHETLGQVAWPRTVWNWGGSNCLKFSRVSDVEEELMATVCCFYNYRTLRTGFFRKTFAVLFLTTVQPDGNHWQGPTAIACTFVWFYCSIFCSFSVSRYMQYLQWCNKMLSGALVCSFYKKL